MAKKIELSAQESMMIHNLVAKHRGAIKDMEDAVRWGKSCVEITEKAKWVSTSAVKLSVSVTRLIALKEGREKKS